MIETVVCAAAVGYSFWQWIRSPVWSDVKAHISGAYDWVMTGERLDRNPARMISILEHTVLNLQQLAQREYKRAEEQKRRAEKAEAALKNSGRLTTAHVCLHVNDRDADDRCVHCYRGCHCALNETAQEILARDIYPI